METTNWEKEECRWSDICSELIGSPRNSSISCNNLSEIVKILKSLPIDRGQTGVVIPGEGEYPFLGCTESSEENCLEFTVMNDIMKPAQLILEFIKERPSLSYFMLRNHQLSPVIYKKDYDGMQEEIMEISPGQYISVQEGDLLLDSDPIKSENIRLVRRTLRSQYIICSVLHLFYSFYENIFYPYPGLVFPSFDLQEFHQAIDPLFAMASKIN